MRTKSLVLLLLALGCGLIAAIGISQLLERNRLAAAPAVEMEDIVVAIKEIKQGDKLKADLIGLKPFPVGTVPEGSYRSIKEALKNTHKLKSMMLKDEPIVLAKFQTQNEDLTLKIPEGFRVVSIQADSTIAAGNLLNPGDRVDVLLYVPGNGQNQTPVVKTILQNIGIFSVNDNWGSNPAEQANNPAEKNTRFVTLLVKPDQAKILTLAQMQGTLKLSLRSQGDTGITADDPVLNTRGVLSNQTPNANSAGEEEEALGILAQAKNLLAELNASAKEAQAEQDAAPVAAPTTTSGPVMPVATPIETFQTTVIEGSQARVVDMSREKKLRAVWSTDGKLRPAPPVAAPAPDLQGAVSPVPAGSPVPNVKNLAF